MKRLIAATAMWALAAAGAVALGGASAPQPASAEVAATHVPAAAVAASAPAQVGAEQLAGAKNVILFVGDGMGISTVTAARILEGQMRGGTGEGNELSFESLPTVGLSRVFNWDFQVPDSAGAVTALMAGQKTDRGLINVAHEATRADCSTLAGNELTSWVMAAEELGLATGVVTTARLSHATPAGAYAVSVDRAFESDANLPAGCSQPDIARQLIEFPFGDGIDVALGGGRRSFTPTSAPDPENSGQTGLRQDGRNLASEWAARPGAEYVWNQAQFDAINPAQTDQLLGLFARSHMRYEHDRADDQAGEPSLTEMTEKAIEILSRDTDGFVLVVEAGRIDHAHHGTNAYRALTETIELSDAVARTLEMVNLNETLVVVTADHSHGLTISGYPTRGNDILGLVDTVTGSDGLPFTTLNYASGPEQYLKPDGSRIDLSTIDTTDPDFIQPSLVPGSATHTGEDVAIYAAGPRNRKFDQAMGQGKIGRLILNALLRFHGA